MDASVPAGAVFVQGNAAVFQHDFGNIAGQFPRAQANHAEMAVICITGTALQAGKNADVDFASVPILVKTRCCVHRTGLYGAGNGSSIETLSLWLTKVLSRAFSDESLYYSLVFVL